MYSVVVCVSTIVVEEGRLQRGFLKIVTVWDWSNVVIYAGLQNCVASQSAVHKFRWPDWWRETRYEYPQTNTHHHAKFWGVPSLLCVWNIWWGKFSQKHNYTYMGKWWCLLALDKLHVSVYSGHLQVWQLFCNEFYIICLNLVVMLRYFTCYC